MATAAPGTRTALALSAIAALTVAFGLIGDAAGLGLGTEYPPFFVTWDPDVSASSLAWIGCLCLAAAASVALVRGAVSPPTAVAGLTITSLGGSLALAAARGGEGTGAWYSVFGSDPEAANEYLPALPALDLGTGTFLDRYAEIAPSLPIHPSAHPPGTLLVLDWLGITSPEGMAALVIAAGALLVPLTYLTARRLDLADGTARVAALLVGFAPGVMVWGTTSADALFAALGLAAGLLMLGPGWWLRVAGGFALAVASFFSWALLAIGALVAVLIWIREGFRAAFATGALAGAALLVFYGLLHAATGYDPLGVLAAANEAYELGISNARPWLFWLFGSPVAFFLALGLPVAWYAARALGSGADVAVALAVVVLIAALLGFSKAETERIWLFMAPFACLAAARFVPREKLGLLTALLVAQAVAIELLLETVW